DRIPFLHNAHISPTTSPVAGIHREVVRVGRTLRRARQPRFARLEYSRPWRRGQNDARSEAGRSAQATLSGRAVLPRPERRKPATSLNRRSAIVGHPRLFADRTSARKRGRAGSSLPFGADGQTRPAPARQRGWGAAGRATRGAVRVYHHRHVAQSHRAARDVLQAVGAPVAVRGARATAADRSAP